MLLLWIIALLILNIKNGYLLKLYDPQAMDNIKEIFTDDPTMVFTNSPYEAADQSNALIILTNWSEFISLDFLEIKRVMSSPIIIDGRNCLNPEQMKCSGLEYYAMGRS